MRFAEPTTGEVIKPRTRFRGFVWASGAVLLVLFVGVGFLVSRRLGAENHSETPGPITSASSSGGTAPGGVSRAKTRSAKAAIAWLPGSGRVADAQLEQVVAERLSAMRPQFGRCYQRALIQDPEATGDITLTLSLSPTGEVDQVQFEFSGDLHETVALCIRQRVQAALFPASTNGGRFVVPLELENLGNRQSAEAPERGGDKRGDRKQER